LRRRYSMAIIGNPRSFHKKFKFIVEIDGVGHAGFQKCSELSVEVANVQYFEGGSLIPNKSPGRLTYPDVTLERGATQDRDLYDWFQEVATAASGLGLTDAAYKRGLDIVQQDRDGSTLRRWSLSRAWPVKFVAGEWDNESDENVIEFTTLTYDYFELIQ
jgi:phage tail-like protein